MEFYNASKDHPELCLIAANRVGKSDCAAVFSSIQLTGIYPDWWDGRMFNEPIRMWTGANTNEASRDIIQMAFLGPTGSEGTGWLPKENIVEIKYRQAGVPNVVDTVIIKRESGGYRSGGYSKVNMKTYDQGFQKWMGTSQHGIWLDEESPMNIFTESLTRILDVKGFLLNTFTPLLGTTDVVDHFLRGGPGIFVKNVTWEDAPHLDKDEMARLALSYPEWERESRMKGVPMMGSGAVYPVKDSDILIPPFEIPNHFYRICGVDFGIDHPAAAAWLAHDRDADIVYVTDCYKKAGQTPIYHGGAIRKRVECPVAWPHDGMVRDKGTGQPLYKSYKRQGVKMIRRSARYEEDKGGPQGVEPAVVEILERMMTGRFKVFETCNAWMEEKRMYHRKDHKIVAERDDIMSATRIAMMDLRKAKPKTIMYIQQSSAQPILRGLHGR